MTAIRDIAHEQVAGSTTEQLHARQSDLRIECRARGGVLPPDKLAELHKIESELYCRSVGIESVPWVTWAGLTDGRA